MNISIDARHMEITDAIRAYAQDKVLKLQRYYSRLTSADIVIDMDGGNPTVEVVVAASHNSTFVGRHRGEDMYGCIDNAVHKVEEQLRRHKDRLRDHKGPNSEGQVKRA